jgi:hypothetical protein
VVAAPARRRYHTRTFTFRISARSLLQGVVLAFILYQVGAQ